jgi:hypothetical protein
VLAALGPNAGNVLNYASQLGAALDQRAPGTTASIPITAQIKPYVKNPDGTVTVTPAAAPVDPAK